MTIDYNELSRKYDLTRTAKIETIVRMASGAEITPSSVVVDFGCGTGNFAHAFSG